MSLSEKEFLDQNAARAFNVALRLTGNNSDACDIAKEALVLALKKHALPSSSAGTPIELYRVICNVFKKRQGIGRHFDFISVLGPSEKNSDLESEKNSIPVREKFELTTLSSPIQKALLQLDDERRMIVILRDLEGQNYRQIAAILNIQEVAVKAKLSSARETLCSQLTNEHI